MDVIRLGLLGNEDGDPFALVKAAACYRLELLLASRKLGRQVKGRIRLSRICCGRRCVKECLPRRRIFTHDCLKIPDVSGETSGEALGRSCKDDNAIAADSTKGAKLKNLRSVERVTVSEAVYVASTEC